MWDHLLTNSVKQHTYMKQQNKIMYGVYENEKQNNTTCMKNNIKTGRRGFYGAGDETRGGMGDCVGRLCPKLTWTWRA